VGGFGRRSECALFATIGLVHMYGYANQFCGDQIDALSEFVDLVLIWLLFVGSRCVCKDCAAREKRQAAIPVSPAYLFSLGVFSCGEPKTHHP
jgi:hypothetical protein